VKEIVLTGVNIGDFGRSTGENFFELIHKLDAIEGIERFRISSIEPNLLTKDIIVFVAQSKRFAPHFHIPLQSGCNEILGLMGRRYTRELFADRIQTIKEILPNACIGADVIVGFPGETDERFNDTCTFIESLDISYLHVFSYSERRNTRAILLPQKVNPRFKELRSQKLIEISDVKRNKFYLQHIGTASQVLFESQQVEGNMHGFTPNYIKVEAPFDKRKINQSLDVKLSHILPTGDFAIEYI
jgi:threonylcarbamoyladenosine tRNA methylthiotransferase MtaB